MISNAVFFLRFLEAGEPDKKSKEQTVAKETPQGKTTKDARDTKTRRKLKDAKDIQERPAPVDTPDSVQSKGLEERQEPAKISEPQPVAERSNLKLLENLKDAEKKFFDSVEALAGDPTLASEIIGFFVPVRIHTNTGDIENGTIPVTIDLRNLTQNPLRLRVNMQPPEGWTAATDDSVSLDNQLNPGKETPDHLSGKAR